MKRFLVAWLLSICCCACIEGSRSLSNATKYVTFVIEQDWSPGATYGNGGKCTSGGFNHAKNLLRSFLKLAKLVEPERKPFLLAPAATYASTHGTVPDSIKWADYFEWDVDNDEFRLPTDVWKAYNATPQRFEIFDAYQPHNIVQRLKQSEAEIALIHMYRRKNQTTKKVDRCTSYFPFMAMLQQANTVAVDSIPDTELFRPSATVKEAATTILNNLRVNHKQFTTEPFRLTTLHVRRGDILHPHLWPKPTVYYGFTHLQLQVATSPQQVLHALRGMNLSRNSTIVMFTNEEDMSMFQVVMKEYPLLYTERELLQFLPIATRQHFHDAYSPLLIFIQIARAGKAHICTVQPKFETPCTSKLVKWSPKNCTRSYCPWVCYNDGHCEPDPVIGDLPKALEEQSLIEEKIFEIRVEEDERGEHHKKFYPPPCRQGGPKMRTLCARLEVLVAEIAKMQGE